MYCNEQSKFRRLRIEWEQVSETGPPHDKTFTWSLKMGDDLSTMGVGNSKKAAKNKAAEEMVLKLDKLPKRGGSGPAAGQKRNFNQMMGGGGPGSHHRGQHGPPPGYFHYNRMPPPQHMMMMTEMGYYPPYGGGCPPWMNPFGPGGGGPGPGGPHPRMPFQNRFPNKKRKNEPSKEDGASKAAPLGACHDNPISKLYEHCKRHKMPEPIFECVGENVLESRRTNQGFNIKKTEFTIRCNVGGKSFEGAPAMTKKQAKYKAAEAAWADIGGGVPQQAIDDLLTQQRNSSQ